MRLAGIRFQKDLDDGRDDHLVAENVKRFLEMLPKLDVQGQIAARRIERLCDAILQRG